MCLSKISHNLMRANEFRKYTCVECADIIIIKLDNAHWHNVTRDKKSWFGWICILKCALVIWKPIVSLVKDMMANIIFKFALENSLPVICSDSNAVLSLHSFKQSVFFLKDCTPTTSCLTSALPLIIYSNIQILVRIAKLSPCPESFSTTSFG